MSTPHTTGRIGVGRIIGDRYRIESTLGRGGMGRVFLAQHTGTGAQMALKFLHEDRVSSERALRRFELEARNAAVLRHTNTIRVFDYGVEQTDDGPIPYIAMEYLDGRSLRDVIQEQAPMPWERVVHIVMQVLKSLWEAHEHPRGIVHRDIKPSNIMLIAQPGDPDLIKVLDFGISRALASPDTQTQSQIGSPETMAPEQWQNGRIGPQTDLYSLGCLTYHLLAGRPPFAAEGIGALALMHVSRRPNPLADLARSNTPSRLVEWVAHLMRKDPVRRPASAREALRGLEELVASDVGTRIRRLETSSAAPSTEEASPEPVMSGVPTRPKAVEWVTLREVTASGPPPTNLQRAPTTFVGRQEQLAELSRLFDNGARLVTVHGPGGAGKTRISREWALAQVDTYPGGVWFCDLSDAESVEGVCIPVATTLDVPLSHGDPVEQLGYAIRARERVLLILDNMEQVAGHGSATIASWRDRAPEARFLVTSRERLRLTGEQVVCLEPLALPDVSAATPERLVENDAVALFVDRARSITEAFDVTPDNAPDIAELVRRLDGLPLAIELAAARARLMTPRRMLERLTRSFDLLRSRQRDVTSRQATLEATLDWSWRLLDDAERAALCQCGVFGGGFSLEAAEAVVDLEHLPDAPWVLDLLESLCDKSLVRTWALEDGEPRFGLYASIQRYALQKLREGGQPLSQAQVARRHALHYAELGAPDLLESSLRDPTVMRTLQREFENLWRALQWAIPTADAKAVAVACAAAFYGVLVARGTSRLFREPAERLLARSDLEVDERASFLAKLACTHRRDGRLADAARLLDLASELIDQLDDGQRARLLESLADMRWRQGKPNAGLIHIDEALVCARRAGAVGILISATGTKAILTAVSGHTDDALPLFLEEAALAREHGHKSLEARALCNAAYAYLDMCRADLALPVNERGIELAREMRERPQVLWAVFNQGRICHAMGQTTEARRYFEEGINKAREIGNFRLHILLYLNLIDLDLDLGRHSGVGELAERVLALVEEFGSAPLLAELRCRLRRCVIEIGDVAVARSACDASLEQAVESGETIVRCTALWLLGREALLNGEHTLAREHLEASLALARESSWLRLAGAVTGYLGVLMLRQEDHERARRLLEEAESTLRELTAPFELGVVLAQRSLVEHQAGDPTTAAMLLTKAETMARRLGVQPPAALSYCLDLSR